MQATTALRHTLDFVNEYLSPGASVLEVGCGKGGFAVELMKAGYKVTAIDLSPENVEAARQLDVRAEVADIEHFESTELFDAVLFTRSLHHIRSLDPVLTKVKALLTEKGRILIEDFAVDQMDEKTAEWFYDLRDVFHALTGTVPSAGETPLARWKHDHEHEHAIHSRAEMLRMLERKFGNPYSTTAPYLYRYFDESCAELPAAASAIQKIFDWEKKLIDKKAIQPIGLRIVAKKYFSYLR